MALQLNDTFQSKNEKKIENLKNNSIEFKQRFTVISTDKLIFQYKSMMIVMYRVK